MVRLGLFGGYDKQLLDTTSRWGEYTFPPASVNDFGAYFVSKRALKTGLMGSGLEALGPRRDGVLGGRTSRRPLFPFPCLAPRLRYSPSMNHSSFQEPFPLPRRAFTLIELLVVISIVALLIAMLLPALSRARSVAQITACASKLRQVGMASQLYLLDNEETYYEHLETGANGQREFAQGGNPDGDPDDVRPLNDHVGHAYEVFYCPADRGPAVGVFDSFYEMSGSSYVFNACGIPTWHTSSQRNLNESYGIINNLARNISEPSRFVVFGDSPMREVTWGAPAAVLLIGWRWDTGWGGGMNFHEPKFDRDPSANIAFADGHVTHTRPIRGQGRHNDVFDFVERRLAK